MYLAASKQRHLKVMAPAVILVPYLVATIVQSQPDEKRELC